MSDLEQEWQELVDAGETEESFDSWYSARVDRAMDRGDMER